MTSIVVLQAGLRSPSTTKMLADELVRETTAAMAGVGHTTEVTTIDIRDHAHAIADTFLTGFSTSELQAALDQTTAADALVVVTPTFSASYSGLFKSFIDIIEAGTLAGKPVILAATGGTERHSLMLDHALRPLFVYLGADPVRTGVFAATGDFGGGDGQLTGRVRRAANELAARLVPAAGASATPVRDPEQQASDTPVEPRLPKGFGDDVVPFEDLMNNLGVGR